MTQKEQYGEQKIKEFSMADVSVAPASTQSLAVVPTEESQIIGVSPQESQPSAQPPIDKAPLSLEASMDLLVGLMAKFSDHTPQREMAAEVFQKVLEGCNKNAVQGSSAGVFMTELLCAFSCCLRALAVTRGTFFIGSSYLKKQMDLRIGYFDSLSGLQSLNREALTWRILGISAGSGGAILVKDITNLSCKVSANPWHDENNRTPRHHGAKSDWASGSHHS